MERDQDLSPAHHALGVQRGINLTTEQWLHEIEFRKMRLIMIKAEAEAKLSSPKGMTEVRVFWLHPSTKQVTLMLARAMWAESGPCSS